MVRRRGDQRLAGSPAGAGGCGMILHGYWRSGTSYRVRIAIAHKGLTFTQAPVNLLAGTQRDEAFRRLNPQGLVPSLELEDGTTLIQSSAILEWLEETYPEPPLLPAAVAERAVVRAMSALVACDIHPLNNIRVLTMLRQDLGADEEAVRRWTARWIKDGLIALEQLVTVHGRGFAFGDSPTFADCHLVPQLYSADRFGIDLAPYPRLVAASEAGNALPAFQAAHPSAQPDAPAA